MAFHLLIMKKRELMREFKRQEYIIDYFEEWYGQNEEFKMLLSEKRRSIEKRKREFKQIRLIPVQADLLEQREKEVNQSIANLKKYLKDLKSDCENNKDFEKSLKGFSEWMPVSESTKELADNDSDRYSQGSDDSPCIGIRESQEIQMKSPKYKENFSYNVTDEITSEELEVELGLELNSKCFPLFTSVNSSVCKISNKKQLK